MRRICAALLLLLAGCGTPSQFRKQPDSYTAYHVGDEFEVRDKLVILSYDYLLIPLVNPGIQLFRRADLPANQEQAIKFKITGELEPGDKIRVVRFKVDGGWIPCQGDHFMANPLCEVLTGKSKGMTTGISLISHQDEKKNAPFRTGKMHYLEPDSAVLRPLHP